MEVLYNLREVNTVTVIGIQRVHIDIKFRSFQFCVALPELRSRTYFFL